MKAEAAVVVTNREFARIRYSHFETVASASSECPMCAGAIEAHVPHACAKPDLDHPPHAVRARCEPLSSATFPFLVHKGITWRFEGRVYRCTDCAAHLVESREHFYEMVAAGVLEEVPHANA